ncbi:MAG TPA: polysaccharide deacetylase family protein [Nitrospiria bacterium]|nr:polysaccharide deacetylase family protein [Nitrospiria bacterium]
MTTRSLRRVPILLYHKIGVPPSGVRRPRTWVSPERFAWQMRYLSRRGWRCITPEALAAHYRGEKEAGADSILITFDDGSRTCFTEALPVMRPLGLTATVFVVSGQLGGRAVWDRDPDHPDDELLTAGEIGELARAGWSIGAHSVTHSRLPALSQDEAEREIRESKLRLEEALSIPIGSFAYPYGACSPEHARMVRKVGYEIGFTTHYPERGLYAVRRENIHGEVRALRFLWRFARARRGEFHRVEA